MCIVLYFEIILFEINIFYLKKTLSILTFTKDYNMIVVFFPRLR